MSKLSEAIGIIENNSGSLNDENINQLFTVLEARANELEDFDKPWTPQAKRSDVKVAAWLGNHGKPATYTQIASGLSETYEGVTAEAVEQVVKNDQAITNVKFRKFTVNGDMVSLVVKKSAKAKVVFKLKA